jgi:N-acetylneuraminic acid mutarotase
MGHIFSRIGARLVLFVGIMSLLISLAMPIKTSAASLQWTTRTPMQAGRAAAGASAVNGKIYVTGGVNNDGFLTSTEAYDPATNTWQSRASIPTARLSFGTASYDGKFYVFGGYGETSFALTSVEVYDPVANSWSSRASMPVALAGTRAVVSNGKIYVVGGRYQNAAYADTVAEYDPVANSWALKSPMPTPRTEHALAVADDGIVYAMGGFNDGYLSTVEAYNPATDSWTSRTNMPVHRVDQAAETLNGHIFVAGGLDNSSGPGAATATVYTYDPTTDTWATAPAMSLARSNLTLSAVSGHLYAIGGEYDFVGASTRTNAVEEGTFTDLPLAPTNLTTAPYTKTFPVLNWNASSGATSYNVYRNGSLVATNVTATTFNDNTPVLTAGAYSYYVTAVSTAGESDLSNTVNTTIDRTRPVIQFTSPASFAGPFAQGPTVSIQVTDATALTSMAIHVYTSGNALLNNCGSASPSQLATGSMSCNLSSLPSGTYYIKAGAFDSATNNGTVNSGLFTIL